jgi:MFS transporter, DHA1 family, arabinose polymer utilization protein
MPNLPKATENAFRKDLKVLKTTELWMVILLTTIGKGGCFAWYSYIAPLITDVADHSESIISYAMILAGLGMVIGILLGAKIALLTNSFRAYDKTGVLIMTFILPVIAFCIATPIQIAVINSAKGSEMLGSSLNQSAFNMGYASGAYLAGLPIVYGYGIVSAQYLGAAMASAGIIIGIGVIYTRKRCKIQLEVISSQT